MAEAREPQIIPIRFEVRPTAAQTTEQHADIALTGLFTAHANQISSERQTIWQRYTAMFIGNSVVLAFVGAAGPLRYRIMIGSLFGIALCVLWWGMTVSGWSVFRMRVDRALEFSWLGLDEQANPFLVTLEYERGHFGGWLYRLALAVIALFIILHMINLVAGAL